MLLEQIEPDQIAKKLLVAAGFEDLAADLTVLEYSAEELAEVGVEGEGWAGQYVRGSVDSEHGLTVLVAAPVHEGVDDRVDTILHECGHALWELLDPQAQAAWGADDESQEVFADNLMHFCTGAHGYMDRKELWVELVQPG